AVAACASPAACAGPGTGADPAVRADPGACAGLAVAGADPGEPARAACCGDPGMCGRAAGYAAVDPAAIRLRPGSRAGLVTWTGAARIGAARIGVAGGDELASGTAGGPLGVQGGLEQDGRGRGVDDLAAGAGVLPAAAQRTVRLS